MIEMEPQDKARQYDDEFKISAGFSKNIGKAHPAITCRISSEK